MLITYKEASGKLKAAGLKPLDLAERLGIKRKSLYSRWEHGLDINAVLLLEGYILENDNLLQRCRKHRDNPALLTLLDELDAKAELQEQIKQSKGNAEPKYQSQKNTPLNP